MKPHPPLTNALAFVVCLALPLLAGAVGSIATTAGLDPWYAQLNKPPWTPPSWVFGPVWTTLYILMGLAAFLVWRRGGFGANLVPLSLFLVQLLLNAGWSFVFFYYQQIGWAAVHILVLWVLLVLTLLAFAAVRRLAALLLVPYLLWTTYAATLNIGFWFLN